jgi:uncharacterized protein involved in exopolysaccharide biosynthesis
MKPGAKNRLKPAASFLSSAGLVAVACGLAYLFLTPKLWEAEAKVRVEARGRIRSDANGTKQSAANESLYMLAERQLMRSDELLDRVISNLHLREKWGNNLQPGALMGTNQTLRLLRAKADIQIIPHTSVLQIKVTSEDAAETAPIANEIARLYCDHRQTERNAVREQRLTGLQTQWERENNKLSQARQQLENIVLEIKKERAAAADSLYAPDAYESMQSDRDQRELTLVAEEAQLNHLKTLKPGDLRLLLPTLVTNDALDASLENAAQAQRALADARAKPGADPGEVKSAAALADDAEQRLSQAMVGVISEREADLAMHKSVLEKLDQQLKTARTNVDELSPDNPAYVAAQRRVEQIEAEGDQLKDRLTSEDSKEALSPLTLAAQIVDSADVPSRPISPDRGIGLGAVCAGALVSVVGLLLFWMAAQMKPIPKPAPAPLPFSKVRQN